MAAGGALIALLVWQIVTARGGTPDPTEARLSHGAVIVDSAVLVFREGLESILVLAAVTASLIGANRAHRRPVAAGGGGGAAPRPAGGFAAMAVVGAGGGASLDVQAATGLLAVVV